MFAYLPYNDIQSYVNDVSKESGFQLLLIADDTALYIVEPNANYAAARLQLDSFVDRLRGDCLQSGDHGFAVRIASPRLERPNGFATMCVYSVVYSASGRSLLTP